MQQRATSLLRATESSRLFTLYLAARRTYEVLHGPPYTLSTHHRTFHPPATSILSSSRPTCTPPSTLGSYLKLAIGTQQVGGPQPSSNDCSQEICGRLVKGFDIVYFDEAATVHPTVATNHMRPVGKCAVNRRGRSTIFGVHRGEKFCFASQILLELIVKI